MLVLFHAHDRSDEDSDTSESGKDEFNFHHQHARPSSPSNLQTSGDSRDRLLSQVLSIKEEEEESSEVRKIHEINLARATHTRKKICLPSCLCYIG